MRSPKPIMRQFVMLTLLVLLTALGCTAVTVEPAVESAALAAYPEAYPNPNTTPAALGLTGLDPYPGPPQLSYDPGPYNDSLTREASMVETAIHITLSPGIIATTQANIATSVAEHTSIPTATIEAGIFYTGTGFLSSMRPPGMLPMNVWRDEINGERFIVYAGVSYFNPDLQTTPQPPLQTGRLQFTRILNGDATTDLFLMDYDTGPLEIMAANGSVLTIQSAGTAAYPSETFYFDVLTESFIDVATPATPIATRRSCRPRPGRVCLPTPPPEN
jgi:hypothetical protein